MKTLVLGLLLTFTRLSFAIDCPTLKLECQLQTLGHNSAYETVAVKTQGFVGYNFDEPSLPADTCEINLVYSAAEINKFANSKLTPQKEALHANMKENLDVFFHVSQGSSAIGAQFQTTAHLNTPITLTIKQIKMICTFLDPNKKDSNSDY